MAKEKKGGLGKFLVGAIVGAAAGVLLAPKKGSETRDDLKKEFDKALEKIKSVDKEELKLEIEAKIKELQEGLENLNKEDILEEADKAAKILKEKSENLLDFVIKNGTPFLEKAVAEIRDVVTDGADDVIKKLKDKK